MLLVVSLTSLVWDKINSDIMSGKRAGLGERGARLWGNTCH